MIIHLYLTIAEKQRQNENDHHNEAKEHPATNGNVYTRSDCSAVQ